MVERTVLISVQPLEQLYSLQGDYFWCLVILAHLQAGMVPDILPCYNCAQAC